jgi:hypothetical protein
MIAASSSALSRSHRGPGAPSRTARRRLVDPTTCERDYRPDELEFMQAVEAYKRRSGRMFPTCSELLEIVRSLGYTRLTAPA